jgi:hypothetical protein
MVGDGGPIGRVKDALSRSVGAFTRLVAGAPRDGAGPSGPAAPTHPDSSSESLARFLASELRLPLAALARLGERCAASSDAELARVGRALSKESGRLDVVVANGLEFGAGLVGEPFEASGRADLRDVVERVVAGHRVLVEALAIRVRVLDSTRSPRVSCDAGLLFDCLAALFADLLERAPAGSRVDVRVRELLGFARVDGLCAGAANPGDRSRPAVARAQELAARRGGEAWDVADRESGFGLTLPLCESREGRAAVARREPRARPALA